MKKLYFLPLAATLAATPAFAQSSVSLYGMFDLSYGTADTAQGHSGMMSNYNSTSRWGLKGSEDLGHGLSAQFNLEQGIMPTTGAVATVNGQASFNRAAWVGISGSFGQVRAGRMFTVVDNAMGTFDLNGGSNYSSALGRAKLNPWRSYDSPTPGGQLQYDSPEFGGLSFTTGLVLKNDNVYGADYAGYGSLARDLAQFTVRYTQGALTLGGTVENNALPSDGRMPFSFGAKYDFGPLAVAGMYSRLASDQPVTPLGVYGQGIGLGIAAPLGAWKIGLQGARNTTANKNTVEAFATYALSKRTSAYVNYGYLWDRPDRSDAARVSTGTWAVGITHSF